jgi:hypothetical protein
MFTHVFDEMQRGFFDEGYFPRVRLDRLMAHECYELAVEAMTLIVQGFTIEYVEAMTGFTHEYADIECWDLAVVACTRYELSRVSEWANKARMHLQHLQHDVVWDKYVKADKLEQQARNLWEVARAME